MLELDDNALIALGLREHAQTCDAIAAKYPYADPKGAVWKRRADRCRDLANRYHAASEKPKNLA